MSNSADNPSAVRGWDDARGTRVRRCNGAPQVLPLFSGETFYGDFFETVFCCGAFVTHGCV